MPSTANTVFPQPIVGISTSTPKCEARPNPLLWKIPFPSTNITWGIYLGEFFLRSLIKLTKCFTSLKA